MKIFSKKVLSIVVAVCLLAGIAIPAGIFSASAETKVDVWEFDFPAAQLAGTGNDISVYKHIASMQVGAEYTYSFDYYLNGGAKIWAFDARSWASSSTAQVFPDGGVLSSGKHSFSYTFTAGDTNFIPGFNSGFNGAYSTLYVWNASLVKSGTTTNLLDSVSYNKTWATKLSMDPAAFDTPIVTELKFTDGALTYSPAIYQGDHALPKATDIVISFDYYLADDVTFTLDQVAGHSTVTVADTIEKGIGNYSTTFQLLNTSSGVFCPRFTASAATTLYIWNMKITVGGTEKVGILHPASYSKAEEIYTLSAGAQFLSAYAWAQPEEETVVYKLDYSTVTSTRNEIAAYPGAGFNGSGDITSVAIEFDYYLTDDVAIILQNAGGRGAFYQEDGSCELKPGLHTYKGTWTKPSGAGGGLYPGIYMMQKWGNTTRNVGGQLYVWDMKITANNGAIAANNTFSYDLSTWASGGFAADGGTVTTVALEDVPTAMNNGGMYKLEIDATAGEKDIFRNYLAASAGTEYTFSFDYWIPTGVTAHAIAGGWTAHYDSDSGLVKDATTGTSQLAAGKGSFSATVKSTTTQLPFGVRLTTGQSATIYVWNVSMKKANAGNNLYAGVPWNGTATKTFIPYDEALFVNPDDGGDGGETGGDGGETGGDGGETGGDGGETPASSGVYEIDFVGAGTTDADEVKPLKHYYNAGMTGKTYTFSFDYYLPYGSYVGLRDYAMNGNETGFVDFAGGGRWSTLWLENGVHHYEKEFTASLPTFIPGFFAHAMRGYSSLYVWNFSLVENGTTTNLLDDVAFSGISSDYINKIDVDPTVFGTSPIVAEIQFAENALTWTPALYQANAVMETGKKIVVSFDYYLADDTAITLNNVPGWPNNASEEQAIKKGRGQYTGSFTLQGAALGGESIGVFCPKFTAEKATTLYVWNVKITLDGVEKIGYVNPANHSTANEIYTIADGAKFLSAYSWKDEPLNTEPEEVIPGDPNDPIVTAIDFTKGDTWVYEVLRNANVTPENPFKVTFEYFLPEKATLQFDSVGGHLVHAGGSKAFRVGHHTFEAEFATDLEGSGYPVPIISPKIVNEDMDAKLYIWNMSVTVDGVEQVPNNPGEQDKAITAGVDESKRLSQYDWYPTMDEVAGNYVDVVANKVYAFRFDKYNWEINEYGINAIVFGRVRDIYAGMNLNLSFDYYIEGAAQTHIFNPYAIWKDFELHPGVNYGGKIITETNKKGHASYDFVTNANDAKHEGGTIGVGFQQQIDYGQAIMYVWNLKLTQDGSNMNLLPEDFEWAENHMSKYGLIQELDIDPSKIGPGMTHPVFDNPDYVAPETDTDDIVIEDDEDNNDPGDVDFGSDIDDITGNFDGEIRVDDDSSIFVSYNGELDANAYLAIYEYAADELTDAALALIGDKKFVAYEVLMALGEEYLDLSGEFVVGIPVPADIDMSVVFAYGIDAYGDLYAVEAEYDVENNYVYITTDVLGSFVLVDGELTLPSGSAEGDEPAEGDQPTDGNEPTDGDEPADTTPDKDDKDSKKDDDSNGWILWVIIGGAAVLLAAGGVAIFFILKKKKTAQ